MIGLGDAFRSAQAALVCLTRVPVGGFPYSDREMSLAAVWFPVIGLLVGAMVAAVWFAAAPLGPLAAATFAVGTGIFVTGALHEDGLADTADAFGGGGDRERVLAILKDPCVGTYGALALAMSVLVRVALLVPLTDAWLALVIAHTVSRWSPTLLIASLPYVTKQEDARSGAVMSANWRQALAASFWTSVILAALVAWTSLTALLAVLLMAGVLVITILGAWQFRRRVGGVTGDMLGASEQITQVTVLLAYGAWHIGSAA